MKINLTKVPILFKKRLLILFMRTFIFLFCSITFGFNYNSGFSQNVKITIDSNRELSVIDVFEIIKKQTDYTFIYRTEPFENAPKLKLRAGVINAHDLLLKALSFDNFTYEITPKRTILIREKGALQEMIRGTVTDESGEPLPGANVMEKDSKNGVATDFNGKFSIEVSNPEAVLIFSYVGYVTQEIKLTGKTEINIQLKLSPNELDEVVLTGYTITKKENSTAAASKIKKEAIERQVTTNLDSRLEGLSPGLIINTFTPDGGEAEIEITLRGVSTFDQEGGNWDPVLGAINKLNRQPLIVLDGFPYEGPFNDIDPETIASMDILRDAAATSIWGIRAANGVIVITTKRGIVGKPRISFKSNVVIGTKQNLNDFGLASSADHIKLFNRRVELTSFPIQQDIADRFNFYSTFSIINPLDEIWIDYYKGYISEAERDLRFEELGKVDNLDQFQDNLLREGVIKQNSLTIRGGNEAAKYSFIATYSDEERPNIGDEFERLNLSLTTDFKLNDKLTLLIDANVANSKKNNNGIGVESLYSGVGSGSNILRFSNLVDANNNPTAISYVYPEYQEEFFGYGFKPRGFNPILEQKELDNSSKTFNLRLASAIKYEMLEGLTLDLRYVYNRITTNLRDRNTENSFYIRTKYNNGVTDLATTNSGALTDMPNGSILNLQETLTTTKGLRGSIHYNKNFNEKHLLDILGGMELSENNLTFSRQKLIGYNDLSGLYDINFPFNEFIRGESNFFDRFEIQNRNLYIPETTNRTVSSFASLSYTYDRRYNISLSGKIDQTSTFGITERLSKPLLYSMGASWNIHNEDFFKTDWIDQLKLRASYGSNGNIRRGLTTVTTINQEGSSFINAQPYASINSPGNPNLKFEESRTINLGLDFSLFDRISGSVDVYDKRSKDLLTDIRINPTVGWSNKYINAGEISNKGIEIDFNADIIKTKNIIWNMNLNFTYNKNEVIKTSFVDRGFGDVFYKDGVNSGVGIEGYPLSTQIRFKWAGLDDQGNPQIYRNATEIMGYQDYSPLSIEDQPSLEGMTITKPFVAPTFGGFFNSFRYKDFTLSLLATYKFGHVFQENLSSKYPYPSRSSFNHAFHKDVANAWENPGDEAITDIPAIPRTSGEANFRRQSIFADSDLFIHDASFIRLRDITLAYRLKNEAIEKFGIKNIDFSIQARDLGLIWAANDRDLDPETVPFSGRRINFAANFPQSFRPGIKVPPSFVFSAKFNF